MGIKNDLNAEDLKREMTRKIEDLEKKVDGAKKDAKEREKRDDKKLEMMNKRLDDFEKRLKSNADNLEQKTKEKSAQLERMKNFNEAVGLKVAEPEAPPKVKTWSELIEENKEKERTRREKAKDTEMKHWKKQVEIRKKVEDIEKGDRSATTADKANEKVDKKKLTDKTKEADLELNTLKCHDDDDWLWDEGERDWEGTEERKNEERRKKLLRYRKRKELKSKTSTRAKHMIGLGPILKQSVNYFADITSDIEEAKKMAINEFLSTYLQFTEEDLSEVNIVNTATAKSDEEIIYVTFSDHDTVRDIYGRAAEIRNNDIQTRIFVPPQFWPRYQHIAQHCANLRDENKDLKTLIRFGDDDIEVLTKDRSKEDHYSVLTLEEIEKKGAIPKFKHEVVWRKRSERPYRRELKPVSGKITPPSLQRTTISRTSSSGSDLHPSKRQKKNTDQVSDTDIADNSDDNL